MERPEYRLRVLAGFFLVENFKVQSSRTVIFDNLWKFTGISVKYKTQIGTNGHKLSKILLLKSQATILNSQFSILNSQFSIFNFQFKESFYSPKNFFTPNNLSLKLAPLHQICDRKKVEFIRFVANEGDCRNNRRRKT